jgi:ribosomal protein S18 acetylase RimI-like enzyme
VQPVIDVRKATAADVPALSGALARAFEDDPVISWLYPGLDRLEGFFRNFELRLHLRHEAVYTTSDIVGGAVWAPPGQWRTSFRDLVRVSPGLLRATGTRLVRGLRTMQAVEGKHPKEPHWYLAALGTDPQHQGHGVGSALMAPILQRCDSEGVPAYLESSKESNIPFYRRHGFEVIEEIALPKGPSVWPMWRDPQPA